jgi:hypothetical protein
MHNTTVLHKDGRKIIGILYLFRPESNFFEISTNNDLVRFTFDEVASVITEGERISYGVTGDMDEVERARKYMLDARKYGWINANTPVMDWENRTKE